MGKEGKNDLTPWLGIATLVFAAISPLCAKGGSPSPTLSPAYTCVALAFLGGIVAARVSSRRLHPSVTAANRLLVAILCAEELLVLPGWSLLGDLSYDGMFKSLGSRLQAPLLSCASFAAGYILSRLFERPNDLRDAERGEVLAFIFAAIGFGYAPRFLWVLLEMSGLDHVSSSLIAFVPYLVALIAVIRCGAKRAFSAEKFCCFYGLGMLLWALSTRVYPLYSSAVLAAVPLAACGMLAALLEAISSTSPQEQVIEGMRDQEKKVLGVFSAAGLSVRELQLAQLARAGKTSKQMAADLGISASTVRVTLGKVYKKLGIAGLEELRTFGCPAAVMREVPREPRKTAHLFSATAFASILPLLPIAAGQPRWGQGQPMLMGVAFALLAHAAFLLVALGHAMPRCSRRVRAIAGTSCVVFGIALFTVTLTANLAGGSAWAAALSALEFPCALFYVWGLLAFWGPRVDERSTYAWPVGLFVSLFLGFTVEELWRSTTSFSVLGALTPFVATVGCCALMLLTDDATLRRRTVVAGAVLVVMGLLDIVELWFAVALVLALVAILMYRNIGRAYCRSALYLTAFAVGVLAGIVLVNHAEDVAVSGGALPAAIGGPTNAKMLVCAAALIVAVFAAVAAHAAYARIRDIRKLADVPTRDERLQGYLVSRGLNTVESQTVTLIAQGKTTAQMAKELHYSQGMINTARRSAYAKLGVNSIEGLLELFSQHIDA